MNPIFMQEAIRLSKEGMDANAGGPFGCVIVKDGEIIGRGWNRVLELMDPTCHAEIMAIRDACQYLNDFQLTGCEIYTSCEPCPMCLGAIYWARPHVVYYANTKADAKAIDFDDSFIYEEILIAPAERSIAMLHYPQDAALQVFNEWRIKGDKTLY